MQEFLLVIPWTEMGMSEPRACTYRLSAEGWDAAHEIVGELLSDDQTVVALLQGEAPPELVDACEHVTLLERHAVHLGEYMLFPLNELPAFSAEAATARSFAAQHAATCPD